MAGKQTPFLLSILFLYLLFFLATPRTQSGIVAVSFVFFFLAAVLFSWGKKDAMSPDLLGILPKKGQSFSSLVALGILFAFFCAIAAEALSLVLYALGLLDSQLVTDKMATFSLPILIFASTLAPLSEEMLFRGAIFGKLTEFSLRGASRQARAAHLPFIAAAAFSSSLFAFMHASYGSVAQIIVAFAIGALLCLSARLSNSLIPAIVAHSCFNIAAIIFTVFLG